MVEQFKERNSMVLSVDGVRFERTENDLILTAKDGRAIRYGTAEYAERAAWYWEYVGVPLSPMIGEAS